MNRTISLLVDGKKLEEKQLNLKKGKSTVSVPFEIANPERWWPNGLGDAHLYNIQGKLSNNDKILSETETNIGLRTIEIVQEKDTAGSSFYFNVNGHPVFMKGANYIPQDVFLNRVSPDKYEHIINSAVKANMNMLRVWGGGIYEKEIFYNLCDQNGILVWQDFMFACAMFPGDEDFLKNVRHEAIDNVKRLRNHPSIALWCGNNECLSAWYLWGWKEREEKQQGKEIADRIWQSYVDIFHKVLPEVVEEYDSDRMYWASSPSAAMGEPENWVDGDVHYWGVWWGKEPFKNYRTQIPRFMSEYGFQSFPELSTVNKYATKDDWDIFSEVMKSHQRSSIGNGTIKTYMDRNYREPKNFPMFLYVGQLLQAEGTRVAMEGHRKNMPYCMGSLYWQTNDCWPVASWSTIDYYGNWKAQHYFAKKAFDEFLVSPEVNDNITDVYVVSDRLEDTPARLELILMDFDGNEYWKESKPLVVKANSSEIAFSAENSKMLSSCGKENILLHVSLTSQNGELLSENILYYLPVKDLQLPKPNIETQVVSAQDGYEIEIRSDKLAKNVYLTGTDGEGFFSDNYFDVLPGAAVKVKFTGAEINDFENKLSVISLVDSYK
jgi:beta-mannosidase